MKIRRISVKHWQRLPRDVRAVVFSACIVLLVLLGVSIPW